MTLHFFSKRLFSISLLHVFLATNLYSNLLFASTPEAPPAETYAREVLEAQTALAAALEGSALPGVSTCQTQDPPPFASTEQRRVNQIYETLQTIHQLFSAHGIKYSMIGGTLLGSVRHLGLIPWDDDGDLAVDQSQMDQIKALKDEFRKKGYKLRWWPGGLQVYPYQGRGLLDYLTFLSHNNPLTGYRDAFVDLMPVAKSDDGQYHYATRFARKNWPLEHFKAETWEGGLTELPFGHLKLYGPDLKQAKEFLDRSYGANWADVAYQTFDHKNVRSREKKEKSIRKIPCARHDHDPLYAPQKVM